MSLDPRLGEARPLLPRPPAPFTRGDAASAVYGRDGNRCAAFDRAFLALQRHLAGEHNDQCTYRNVWLSKDGTLVRTQTINIRATSCCSPLAPLAGNDWRPFRDLIWINCRIQCAQENRRTDPSQPYGPTGRPPTAADRPLVRAYSFDNALRLS
jgi:hypothetical protein